MRTSTAQFELLVSFMEQHGDLSKPSSTASGRITLLERWEQLTNLLNRDCSNNNKTTEKWKKVWTDYKANTKKKAVRLHKAASCSSGSSTVISKLTDLEQRVLNLIGVQVATGLAAEETDFTQEIQETNDSEDQGVNYFQGGECPPLANETQPRISATSSQTGLVSSPFALKKEKVEKTVEDFDIETSTQLLSPSHVHTAQPLPAYAGQTLPKNGKLTKKIRSRRRFVRPVCSEQTTHVCQGIDEEWRKFKMKQQQDYIDLKREQNRIRIMEIEAQRGWQAIAIRALDVLDKVL